MVVGTVNVWATAQGKQCDIDKLLKLEDLCVLGV